MRSDIKKVLGERGKGGSSKGRDTARHYRRTSKHKLALDPEGDNQNTMVSMFEHVDLYAELKHSKINTNPLERYLRSRIGENWDKVYSDIKEKTRGYWAGGYSCNGTIDDLLSRFLIQDTYMEGDIMMSQDYLGRPCNIWKCYGGPFYIDPRDKTLQALPKKQNYRYRRVVEPNKLAWVSKSNPLVQYHKIKHLWYEIKLREATPDEFDRKEFGYYAYASVNHSKTREWVALFSPIVYDLGMEALGGYGLHLVGFRSDCTIWYRTRHAFRSDLWGRMYNYWHIGGPNYFPISKRQCSTKETRAVLKLIEERDKDAGN